MANTVQTPQPQAAASRVHFLDVARALFMLLGIPFHAALIYVTNPWLVSSPEKSAVLEYLPDLLTSFRMPAFFMIAGFFAALLLQRRPASEWFKQRAVRLGVPLLAGLILLIPAQNWLLSAYGSGASEVVGLGERVLSYLWFLPVLLMLCAMLAIGWRWLIKLPLPDVPFWVLGLGVAGWLFAMRSFVSVLGRSLDLFDGLIPIWAMLTFAPFFAIGVLLRINPATMARATRFDAVTMVAALVGLLLLYHSHNPETTLHVIEFTLGSGLAGVCASQIVLALLAKFADQPSALVDRFVDASFTIYLLHHPVIIGLGLIALGLALPPLFEWALISVTTLALCFGAHLSIRRSSILLFVFNGVQRTRGKPRGVLTGKPV